MLRHFWVSVDWFCSSLWVIFSCFLAWLVTLLNFYLQTITDLQEFACTLNKFSPVMVSYTTIVQYTKQDVDTVQSTDPTYFVSTVSRVSLCTPTVTCSFIIRVGLCTHHHSQDATCPITTTLLCVTTSSHITSLLFPSLPPFPPRKALIWPPSP